MSKKGSEMLRVTIHGTFLKFITETLSVDSVQAAVMAKYFVKEVYKELIVKMSVEELTVKE